MRLVIASMLIGCITFAILTVRWRLDTVKGDAVEVPAPPEVILKTVIVLPSVSDRTSAQAPQSPSPPLVTDLIDRLVVKPNSTKPLATKISPKRYPTVLVTPSQKPIVVAVTDTLESTSNSTNASTGSDGGETPASNATNEKSIRLTEAPLRFDRSCSVSSLRGVLSYGTGSGRWEPTSSANKWCAGVTFPLTRDAILKKFQGKRILFLGDSLIRNHFVMTAARLCNAQRYDKCITMMPTPPFGQPQPDHKGPWGCVPRSDRDWAPNATTHCYNTSEFKMEGIPGLTAAQWPRNKVERAAQIRKGSILPPMSITMFRENVTLVYLGVTTPKQIGSVSRFIGSRRSAYLNCDAIFVSIGPHLKLPALRATPSTLTAALHALRRAVTVPIIVGEFVPAIGTGAAFDLEAEQLVRLIEQRVADRNVSMVPQRFLVADRYAQRNSLNLTDMDRQELAAAQKVPQSDDSRKFRCGYYDNQHPALRCQDAATELLLAAALSQMP
jgi:hypothetical protein